MDAEIEDKLTELAICIENGHDYNLDKDTINGNEIMLECSVCRYTKSVELTEEQEKLIDSLFDEESKLLEAILKNKTES